MMNTLDIGAKLFGLARPDVKAALLALWATMVCLTLAFVGPVMAFIVAHLAIVAIFYSLAIVVKIVIYLNRRMQR